MSVTLNEKQFNTTFLQLSYREAHKEPIIYEPNRYFKRWRDIPDEFVKIYSERDPLNNIYQTTQWINLKKRQIFYLQDPNTNPQFSYGKTSGYFVFAYFIGAGLFICYGMLLFHKDDYLIYRKKLKEMRENPPNWKTPPEYMNVPIITPEMNSLP